MTLLQRLISRWKHPATLGESARARAKRRQVVLRKAGVAVPYVEILLAVAGFLQFLILPLPVPQLARKTYIDENAVQPGQVNTLFSWGQVSEADRFADRLGELVDAGIERRLAYLEDSLSRMGFEPLTQTYTTQTHQGKVAGTNLYTTLRAIKTDGSEAVVLCAPWQSRQDGRPNVRGVSTVLTLAKHLQRIPAWSKDIIILFSDHHIEGVEAWLRSYYQYNDSDGVTESLRAMSSSIWGALVLDYPYHSFSHLGLYYDGVNGRLPNQDLVNSAAHVARWVGGVPVRLHNETYEGLNEAENMLVRYRERAKGILRQLDYGASTRPSGPEGLFGQYGVDAVGMFAVPADGPHGFYALGRIAEAQLRSMNNLLERLHASYFLYLMPEPFHFLSVASYLSAPILIGASLTMAGLRIWRRAPSNTAMPALAVMAACILSGTTALHVRENLSAISALVTVFGLCATIIGVSSSNQLSNVHNALLAFTLLETGMLISVATILNYALGAALAMAAGIPLLVSVYLRPSSTRYIKPALPAIAAAMAYMYLDPLQFAIASSKAPAFSAFYLAFVPVWLQTAMAAVL